MKDVILEVSYERARPWAAYLYLPGEMNRKSKHSVPVDPEMVLDLDEGGRLIGIEFLAPQLVSLEVVNSVLERYGVAPLSETAIGPLLAARTPRR